MAVWKGVLMSRHRQRHRDYDISDPAKRFTLANRHLFVDPPAYDYTTTGFFSKHLLLSRNCRRRSAFSTIALYIKFQMLLYLS